MRNWLRAYQVPTHPDRHMSGPLGLEARGLERSSNASKPEIKLTAHPKSHQSG